MKVTKVYRLVGPEGRKCRTHVMRVYHSLDGDDADEEDCDKPATIGIDVETTRPNGRFYRSRLGFCAEHGQKYRTMFATPCPSCNGKGVGGEAQQAWDVEGALTRECPACGGSGKQPKG